jgi:hypothetical protein
VRRGAEACDRPEPGNIIPSPAAGEALLPKNASDQKELMDLVYRRQRHIYDLTRKYFSSAAIP